MSELLPRYKKNTASRDADPQRLCESSCVVNIWMVPEGLPKFEMQVATLCNGRMELWRIVMAKLIEFYVPKNIRNQPRWASAEQQGKIIEFSSPTKQSDLAAVWVPFAIFQE